MTDKPALNPPATDEIRSYQIDLIKQYIQPLLNQSSDELKKRPSTSFGEADIDMLRNLTNTIFEIKNGFSKIHTTLGLFARKSRSKKEDILSGDDYIQHLRLSWTKIEKEHDDLLCRSMLAATASAGHANVFREVMAPLLQDATVPVVAKKRALTYFVKNLNETCKSAQSLSIGFLAIPQHIELFSIRFNEALRDLAQEPVAPLQPSKNRLVPISKIDEDTWIPNSPELVDRKVTALLNKLNRESFESISNQIIAWANKSEKEKDGRTLIQVIRLVFEKATDEPFWSEIYAKLCRRMMEQISQDVQDDRIRNAEGNPITGGQLFRKYLLNRCQEDFERGWSMKESAAAAAIPKEGEVELYSDEYYAPLKTRRQGLGLVKFIGELFRLSMLTERVMHECIKKLVANVEDPDEEELESLCTLLMTAGQSLDTHKAKGHMDIYFSRIRELSKNEKLTPRIRFLLQDIIELRQRKWLPKDATAVPLNECVVEKEGKRGGTPRSQSLTASASNMFWMLSAVVEDNLVEDPPITARSRSSGGSHGRSMFDMSAATSNNPVTKKISLHRKFSMSTSTPNKKDELGQQMADKKSTPGTRKPVVVKARDKANINQDVEEFFDLRNANDGVKKHSMDSPKVYERHLVKGESARLMMTQIEELQLNVKKIPILASLIRTRAILILDQMNLAVIAPTDSDFYGYMRESQVTTPYENLEMLLVEYAKKIMDAEKLIEKSKSAMGLVADGYYVLRSVATSSVVHLALSRTHEGNQIYGHEANGTAAQEWKLSMKSDGTYEIRSSIDEDVFMGYLRDEAQQIVLAQYSPSRWTLSPIDDRHDAFSLSSPNGHALNLYNTKGSNGTSLIIHTKNGGKKQQWRLEPVI